MRRASWVYLAWLVLLVVLLMPLSTCAQEEGEVGEIECISLSINPSFGTPEDMQDNTRTLVPDDQLVALLYAQDFFGLPEYLETDVMDGHFTWITVTFSNGETKRVGGLVAEEYGPEAFIIVYDAVKAALDALTPLDELRL